jgi:hypothetical protein
MYGHRQVWVKGYVHHVVIACGSEVIARHERSHERETVVLDPMHYLALLEQKTRALDQAAPLHPTDEDLSVGPRCWPAGSCRSAFDCYGVCSKPRSRSTAAASTGPPVTGLRHWGGSMCRCFV